MKVVVAAFNQEKALVGAFSVITNLRMELFEALLLLLLLLLLSLLLVRVEMEHEFKGMDLVHHGESAYPADAWVEQQYMDAEEVIILIILTYISLLM